MKKFVYPMVLFTDENDLYTALYPDLDLLASGSTIEEVYARANEYLEFYLVSAIKFGTPIAPMSTFAEIQALNPKKVILLGSAQIDEDEIILTKQEQIEKNFLNEFLFTEGSN